MERRSAVEGPGLLPARLVFEFLPPRLDTADNAVAVLDNLRTRCASSVGGRHIGGIDAVFDIVDSGFEKGLADPKNVVAHKPDRPVAIIHDGFDQPPIGNLPNITLRRAQYVDPFRQKDRWRKRRVPCALDADELGDVFEVLTKNVLPRPAGSLRTSTAVKEIFFFERNSFVLRQLLQPGCVNRTSGSARFSILTAPSCRSGESIKS